MRASFALVAVVGFDSIRRFCLAENTDEVTKTIIGLTTTTYGIVDDVTKLTTVYYEGFGLRELYS